MYLIFSSNIQNPSDKNDVQNGCSIDYYINFEFQNSFYNSAASYVMDFVGGATYDQFVKRAKDLYLNSQNETVSTDEKFGNLKPQEKATLKKFQEKINYAQSLLGAEIHIMNHLRYLASEKLLTQKEYTRFMSMYEKDEDFCERVHTIYDVYNTEQEVHDNQQKILFFLKRSMREFALD